MTEPRSLQDLLLDLLQQHHGRCAASTLYARVKHRVRDRHTFATIMLCLQREGKVTAEPRGRGRAYRTP